MIQLIDTHAHLYAHDCTPDLADIIENSLANHIHKIYMPNIDVTTIEPMLAVEAAYPHYCAAMIGLHPCAIQHTITPSLYQIEHWLQQRPFAAIGEIGIDLYKDTTYQAQQEEALAIQLDWAKAYQRPVIIHCRNSFQATLRLLEKHQDGTLQGIFHCFSGSLEEAQQVLAIGFFLGIGGLITFKNNKLASVVAAINLNHLVLETDSPFLAPAPHRGKRNTPAYLPLIAAQVAAIKQVDVATVAAITTKNATTLFQAVPYSV